MIDSLEVPDYGDIVRYQPNENGHFRWTLCKFFELFLKSFTVAIYLSGVSSVRVLCNARWRRLLFLI